MKSKSGLHYLEIELLLRKILRLSCRLHNHPDARFCAIIQSYKRPQNIDRISRAMLACDFVDHLVISNNNPAIDLRDYLGRTNYRVELIQQKTRKPPAWRFEIARQYPEYSWFINVDDDVFPGPKQLTRIATGLLNNPDAPAGCFAEFFDSGKIFQRGDTGNNNHLRDMPRSLLWIYAFSRKHLEQYNRRLREQGLSNWQSFSDDVLFSMAGGRLPTLIPVGRLFRCRTSNTPGIANFKEPGFHDDRLACYQIATQWLDTVATE